jgi:hypothetical protein
MESEQISLDLLLKRLETDYPSGYNYKVLREAARVIRSLLPQDTAEDGD